MDDSIQIIYDNIDQDDEVVIIDNPRPKPPAPVVVLCDSDDDDDDKNSVNNKIFTEEKKQKNSPNDTQKKYEETGKATSSDVINLDDSDSSCIRVNDSIMNDKNIQMKEWYAKYTSSVSPQSPRYYTCPECLAALSSVYMIDRHIQARHPKSIHRFVKNRQYCILDILSDSESPFKQPCFETSKSKSNSCGKDTDTSSNSNSSILPRLKLSPLEGKRCLNYNNLSERTTSSNTQACDLIEPPPLPPLCSKFLQNDITSTNTKNLNSPTSLASVTSSTMNSKKSELPLARIKPLVSASTKNVALKPSTARKPLTVVICSPNDSTTQERMVKVNPVHDKNVHECIVEVNSTCTDDDIIALEETFQDKTVDNIGPHERVVEFILNANNPKAHDKSTISNSNLSHGNNIVVKRTQRNRTRRNTRAQMALAKTSKNDNHSKIRNTVDTSNDDSTSKETKSSKEPVPILSGTNSTTRKRKRDPLLILTADDDSSEQNIPDKRLRGIPDNDLKGQANIKVLPKKFTCNYCNKRFTTLLGKENHIRDKHTKQKKCTKNIRMKPAIPLPTNPPEIDKLTSMKHIILIDVDNWRKIFESDLRFAPSTFVWAFHGGATSWCPSPSSVLLRQLQEMNCFYLHPKCGKSKDAADFALCVQAGKLDVQLPKEIPFTVLSGDNGFRELKNQLNLSKREVHIVNPHHKTLDEVLAILNSIADK